MSAKTLLECIERVAKPAFKKHGFAQARLLTQWGEIVGPLLARHSLPTHLRFPAGEHANGQLSVRVESAFALEFQHLEPVILEKIATYFGYRAVTRLRILQGPLPHSTTTIAAPMVFGDEDSPVTLEEALALLGKAVSRKKGGGARMP